MSETGEYLEISRRARELDSQVIRLTDQLRDAQKPLNETKAELAEMRGKWSVAVASLEEYQRKGAEAIHQLSTQLTSERNTNVETIRLLKETAVKDRADLVAERNDLLDRLDRWERNAGNAAGVMADERAFYTGSLASLNSLLKEARRTLSCGHHHSLDDNDGGCKLCGPRK